jgi:hypothetical protein
MVPSSEMTSYAAPSTSAVMRRLFGGAGDVLATLASRDQGRWLFVVPDPRGFEVIHKPWTQEISHAFAETQGALEDEAVLGGTPVVLSAGRTTDVTRHLATGEYRRLVGFMPVEDEEANLAGPGSARLCSEKVADALAHHLPKRGSATLLVQQAFLSSSQFAVARRTLEAAGSISDVVELGAVGGDLGLHTQIEMAVIRFVRDANQQTRFTRLSKAGERQFVDALDQLARAQDLTRGAFSTALAPGAPWTAARNDPVRTQVAARLAQFSVRLGDIAVLRLGLHPVAVRLADDAQVTVPLLNGIDVKDDLTPAAELAKSVAVSHDEFARHALMPRDIVGRTIGARSQWQLVPEAYGDVVPASTVIVIGVRPESPVPPEFVVAYLRSEQANRLLAVDHGPGGLTRLRVKDLAELLVPVPGLDRVKLATLSHEIERALGSVTLLRNRLTGGLDAAFDARDRVELTRALEELSVPAAPIAKAFDRTEDLLHRCQAVYPYPVARAVRAYVTALDDRDRYDALLDTAEALVMTLGLVGLAWCTERQVDTPAFQQWRQGVQRGGPSYGVWLGVARDAAQCMAEVSENLSGYADALKTTDRRSLHATCNKLVEERNAARHGSPPRSRLKEHSARLQQFDPVLRLVLEQSGFLARLEWVVPRQHVPLPSGQFLVTAHRVMGDHPDFEFTRREEAAARPHDALWIRPDDVTAHLALAPFVGPRICPECGNEEIYYVNKLKNNAVSYKSFDRGHEDKDAGAFAAMSALLEQGPVDRAG